MPQQAILGEQVSQFGNHQFTNSFYLSFFNPVLPQGPEKYYFTGMMATNNDYWGLDQQSWQKVYRSVYDDPTSPCFKSPVGFFPISINNPEIICGTIDPSLGYLGVQNVLSNLSNNWLQFVNIYGVQAPDGYCAIGGVFAYQYNGYAYYAQKASASGFPSPILNALAQPQHIPNPTNFYTTAFPKFMCVRQDFCTQVTLNSNSSSLILQYNPQLKSFGGATVNIYKLPNSGATYCDVTGSESVSAWDIIL